jgi:hypothetical protein
MCKGNLALLRKSLRSSKGGFKRIYKDGIIHERCTTDLARGDPKRIL